MKQKKRAYSSEARDAQASKTRSRILKEALILFQNSGFDQMTISSLAEAAGVSTPTIYAIFKSKRGVLQALIDEALPPHTFTALVDESMQETSPKERLKISAKLARSIYDAESGLMDILRDASVLSSECKELEQELERRRFERQADFVRNLGPALRMPSETARDILWALTGRDIYRMFVIERGWTSDDYEKWLGDMLAKSLLN